MSADRLAEIMANVEATRSRILELARGPECALVFPYRHGGQVAVTRDASKPGAWRATTVDADGEPTGHTEAPTFLEAIRAAYHRGAVLS